MPHASTPALKGRVHHQLPGIKSLCISRGRTGLYSAQSHKPHKQLFAKPVLYSLRVEKSDQCPGLFRCRISIKVDECIRGSEITIILGDLVFQNGVVAECVPGQFADHPVVLMHILSIMGKNQIRLEHAFDLLENLLDARPLVREKAVGLFVLVGNQQRGCLLTSAEPREEAVVVVSSFGDAEP